MKRELKPFGFRVHPIRFQTDKFPAHIDCTFVVLRDKLAMLRANHDLFPEYKTMFQENGWKFVTAPPTNNPKIPTFSLCSSWMSMNVLILSPDKVIVEAEEENLAKFLESLDFKVIRIPFRDVY